MTSSSAPSRRPGKRVSVPEFLRVSPSFFNLSERFKLQFRAQAINFTNTPHFSNPNGDFNSSSFGQVNGLANTGRDGGVDARQIELHARLSF